MAGGVLPFFEESKIKQFFSMVADNFPGSEIVFDAPLTLDDNVGAWFDMYPQEQRHAMRSVWSEALKDWWEKAPQDQRDEVYDIITTLKTSIKPKGKEWADVEAWWDQLSDKEEEDALRGFLESSRRSFIKWALEDAKEITRCDNRITVIDQFPLYRNIPRSLVSADIRRLMDYSDESGRFNIFHLRM
ncbi:MAG TPA: hypothetical protein VEG44_03690 [Candidatus Acidoferrales bacterium]|nr:hypothetical protein [Candidatus Acidoferrales bacterium]